MVRETNFLMTNLHLKSFTHFLAYSFLSYLKNFRLVLKTILVPQFISIGLVYFLYISLYGEFNLTYFLSIEGKILLLIVFLLVVGNISNAIYQSIKILTFNGLELSDWKFKISLIFLSTLRFVLFILMIASIFGGNAFILFLLTFIILNEYFYYDIFKSAIDKFQGIQSNLKLSKALKLNLRALLLSALSRFITVLIPVFATFSFFIVYEFVRILITGKVFFFIADRLFEFQIWLLLTLILFLIANPFQYFVMIIFYKYYFTTEINKFQEK